MILIRGWYKDTGLTGTVYEPDEEPPEYEGTPNTAANYVWVCDSFYRVDSGGTKQHIDGEEISVAFEKPTKKGFQDMDTAISQAKEHIRTQFSRIGVESDDVTFEILDEDEE